MLCCIIHILCYCTVLFIILNCIRYNHIFICIMYYSLLNSSLPYVLCYMLYVIYCVYIYICVAYVSVGPDQRGLLCAESGIGMRGFQGHMSHLLPLSLSHYRDLHCTHCYCKTAVGPCKKGCSLQL